MFLSLQPHLIKWAIILCMILAAIALLVYLQMTGSLPHGVEAFHQELAYGPLDGGGYKLC